MSSRSETKSASQFGFLTMRSKDKLHPQRRRSEPTNQSSRERAKPPDSKSDRNQSALGDQERAVVSSSQYFKASVDRSGSDRPGGDKSVSDQSMVGGSSGGASAGISEAVQASVQSEPHSSNSKTVSACLSRLYRSVAQSIRWADQVMSRGVSQDNGESSESVTTVIRGVSSSAKELVRLVAERREGSAPLSPVQSQSGGFNNEETSDRTSIRPSDKDSGVKTETKGEEHQIVAPPKPPMPLPELLPQVTPPEEPTLGPPASPPKKRQTSPVPAHCRVAIVTPMIREPEDDTSADQDDSCWKRLSSSSADSAANTSLCEDDPDFDFLHTDSSSSEKLPPSPPASPEKRRRSTTGLNSSQTSSFFGFNSSQSDTNPAPCSDVTEPEVPVSSPSSPSKSPPPLPEKKRHIHQYLQFCSSYSDQSAVLFYQKYKVRQRDHQSDHSTTDPAPSEEEFSVPVLPPKKKQEESDTPEENEDSFVGGQQEAEFPQESSEEDGERELLLADPNEIRQRITSKSEEEEGPEVKAASREILLVQATQPGSSEPNQYQEAFLCTYRGFISPSDILSKLQLRYSSSREGSPADPVAARNTFQSSVRVVNQLSAVESESDLSLSSIDSVFSLSIGGESAMARLSHSNISSKMEKRWKSIGSPQSLCPLAAKGVSARPGTSSDFRSQDLAEQLTSSDSDLFCKIELPEVLSWSKEQNEERSPHSTEFTQHFNNVSFWVRSVIILQEKPQDREKSFSKFSKVMKHSRKLNNFNSYSSISSASDSAPSRRSDWQRSTSETSEEFSSSIDSSSSFRAYRAASAEVEPPCIPYSGSILQDSTFVHSGNPDTLKTAKGSKVNFSKCWQQFNISETSRSFQKVRYSSQRDDDIVSFFNDFSDHSAEEALWELSLRIRPKNAPRTNQR